MSKIHIDYGRAREVLSRIHLAATTGQGQFSGWTVSDELGSMPEGITDPLTFGQYFFILNNWLQGSAPSKISAGRVRGMFESRPDIFAPQTILEHTEDEIRSILIENGLTLHGTRPNWMKYNARILLNHFDGDPRNIFSDLPKYNPHKSLEILRDRTQRGETNMKGFRDKATLMLAQQFVSYGLSSYAHLFPPIDKRQMSIFGSTRSVWPEGRLRKGREQDEFKDTIMRVYDWYAEEAHVPMGVISKEVWHLAGKTCSDAPAAMSRDRIYTPGEVDIETYAKSNPPFRKPYDKTCGGCMLSDLCDQVLPYSGAYGTNSDKTGLRYYPRLKLKDEKPLELDRTIWMQVPCTCHVFGGTCKRHDLETSQMEYLMSRIYGGRVTA